MSKLRIPGFSTRAIHVGQEPDPATGAVTVPIYPTSTYVQEELGKNKGYEYSRVSNPTRTCLEENLASLEGGVAARVFASGMAAINAVATLLKSGDHVVCGHDLYGGTPRLFNQVWAGFGLEFTYVDTTEVENVARAIRRNTRMVYVETPTNPLMTLSDIRAISEVCQRRKADLVVDNTFMSPYFQQPLALGADMVVHSTTKFLNGHSDGLGGVVVCSRPDQAEKLGVPAESGRCNPFAFRVLAGFAWREDSRSAHEAARHQRQSGGRVSLATQESAEGVLSRPASTSPARIGPAADVRLRRDDHI